MNSSASLKRVSRTISPDSPSFAQQKGWLRDDISAQALSVLFQILVFGRALDDVSAEPIDEATWEASSGVLFVELLKR